MHSSPLGIFSLFAGSAYPLYGSPDRTSQGHARFGIGGIWFASLFSLIGLAGLLLVAFGIALILEMIWYRRHPTHQQGVVSPIKSLALRYLGYWIVTTLVMGLGSNVLFYLIAFSFREF